MPALFIGRLVRVLDPRTRPPKRWRTVEASDMYVALAEAIGSHPLYLTTMPLTDVQVKL